MVICFRNAQWENEENYISIELKLSNQRHVESLSAYGKKRIGNPSFQFLPPNESVKPLPQYFPPILTAVKSTNGRISNFFSSWWRENGEEESPGLFIFIIVKIAPPHGWFLCQLDMCISISVLPPLLLFHSPGKFNTLPYVEIENWDQLRKSTRIWTFKGFR